MTSKKSFWANSLENHKRRISIWILAILAQLMAYPAVLIMYYSRIQARYSEGVYASEAVFRKQMWHATCDALCFSGFQWITATGLAVLIAIQGFSFLHSRRKEDMYYSVPISMKNRFRIIYSNGLVIYFAASLIGYGISLLLAVFQGAIDGVLLGRSLISFVYMGLFFIAAYSVVILAVMLTGNILFSIAGSVILMFYATVWFGILDSYKYTFFDRATYMFADENANILNNCASFIQMVTYSRMQVSSVTNLVEVIRCIAPYAIAFVLGGVIFTWIAYKLYMVRPTESAGKAVAFASSRPILKIALIIPLALWAGLAAYNLSERNMVLMAAVIALAALLCGAVLESIFEEDVRACHKHLAPTVVALAIVLGIFAIYKFDAFGYDSYVPKTEEIESFAVDDNVYGIGNEHWSFKDGERVWVDDSTFLKEHMFLKDADAITALANNGLGLDSEDMVRGHDVSVLYRLKNGKQVTRLVRMDFGDESMWPYLGRIFGTEAYVDGFYQAANYDEIKEDSVRSMTYTNGKGVNSYTLTSLQTLYEAWVKDMKKTDFTEHLKGCKPVGMIELDFKSYGWASFYVYEDFSNTISYLKSIGVETDGKLDPEEVQMIRVINYNDQLYGTQLYDEGVAATVEEYEDYTREMDYDDPGMIQEILEASFPASLQDGFTNDTVEGQYRIMVLLKDGQEFSFESGRSLDYSFLKNRVPDFVEADTIYQ